MYVYFVRRFGGEGDDNDDDDGGEDEEVKPYKFPMSDKQNAVSYQNSVMCAQLNRI